MASNRRRAQAARAAPPPPSFSYKPDQEVIVKGTNLRLEIIGKLYGDTYEARLGREPEAPVVTFHVIRDGERALTLLDTFGRMKHGSIHDRFQVGKFNEDTIFVASRKFEGHTFRQWANISSERNLERDRDKNCIGLGPDTKNVLKQIVRVLQSIHDAGAYHGSIEDGIRIGEDGKVFVACSAAYKDDTLTSGIEKDISDFCGMVHRVINRNIPFGTKPKAIQLFYELCKYLFNRPRPENLSDTCFYIYNTPMLWDSEDRVSFKRKVVNIRNRNFSAFQLRCDFTKNPINMTNWDQRIRINGQNQTESDPDFTPEFLVLCYPTPPAAHIQLNSALPGTFYSTVQYNSPGGFVDYERNFAEHLHNHLLLQTEKDIEDYIFNLFPETCSVLYYGLIASFPYFTIHFKEDLRKALRTPPSPCY